MWDGIRRKGKPKSDAERRRRHRLLYGSSKLPKRGSGLKKGNKFTKALKG